MSLRGARWEIVEISGTGSGVYGVQVYGGSSYGVVRSITVREPPGGSATRIEDLALVHSIDLLTSLSSRPPREHVLLYAEGIDLTPSPTAPSIATPLDRPQAFSDGLGAIVNVTATAGWTLRLGLQVADLRDPLLGASV